MVSLTEAVWAALPQYMRDADDGTLAAYLGSLTDLVAPTVDLLMMDDPAEPLVMPRGMLAFFAALGGVDIEGVPDAQLREWVGSEMARPRGSVAAIVARVGWTLAAVMPWIQVECPYVGDVWAMRVTTRASETPDPAATLAAVRQEAPAWLAVSAVTVTGLTYNQLAARYPTYAGMAASGASYDALSQLT